MITFPQEKFTKFLTSSSLPVMKTELIMEKPEVGVVLPSLTLKKQLSRVALSQATFLTDPAPALQYSQPCFYSRSCKIISVLHSAFSGNIFLSVLGESD